MYKFVHSVLFTKTKISRITIFNAKKITTKAKSPPTIKIANLHILSVIIFMRVSCCCGAIVALRVWASSTSPSWITASPAVTWGQVMFIRHEIRASFSSGLDLSRGTDRVSRSTRFTVIRYILGSLEQIVLHILYPIMWQVLSGGKFKSRCKLATWILKWSKSPLLASKERSGSYRTFCGAGVVVGGVFFTFLYNAWSMLAVRMRTKGPDFGWGIRIVNLWRGPVRRFKSFTASWKFPAFCNLHLWKKSFCLIGMCNGLHVNQVKLDTDKHA